MLIRLSFALHRAWRAASGLGALLASACFAASLTPSLLPHDALFQGVLSGVAAAAGYGAAAGARLVWRYLELPEAPERIRSPAAAAAAALSMLAAVAVLWRAMAWQNGIRDLFDMAPVDGTYPVIVGALALLVFAALLAAGIAFQFAFRLSMRVTNRALPRRLSGIIALCVSTALFGMAANGILFDGALRVADSSLKAMDAQSDADIARPTDPMRTGSEASLVNWDAMGRAGREYIASGPGPEDIGPNAMQPIRVYVGLRSAQDPAARARLALAEMQRVGAFERSVLVIASPTGTGWLDPAAMDTLEHLHRGDVATAAIQYSYLLSWISLLVEPGYGAETSRALFREVYAHWRALPRDARPRLYLHGLSLGAMGSERSAGLFEVLGDPFHGAVWSGPPFTSRTWGAITAARAPGSPAWLPRFGDGSIARFTAQRNALDDPVAEWGPMRVVYLQYASDPIVFFGPGAIWREPDWMKAPRGPDVSPDMRWYPVVTFLQLLVDMALATTSPMGHGHVYAPEHYIDAWRAVTEPPGWDDQSIAALKARFIAARD